MNPDTWTIRRLLQWTTDYFRSHGIASPRLDAELLLSTSLHSTRLDLYLDPDRPVDDRERAVFREFVRKRANRTPIAYLIGTKDFYSISIEVTPDVLIPRPETETLIDSVLTALKSIPEPRIADLGTGSGCITAALALQRTDAVCIAIDRSSVALQIAARNFERLGISNRVSLREGNWLDALTPDEMQSMDAIVSNPPYIPTKIIPTLAPEIACHEPHIALDGGISGLDPYHQITAQAHRFLRSGGILAVEIGNEQGSAVYEMFEKNNYKEISIVKDLAEHDRIVLGHFTR